MWFTNILGSMKRILPFLLIFCLVLNTTNAYAASLSQEADYMLSQCLKIEESDLREELEHNLNDFFANETQSSLQGIVAQQWRILAVDATIDSAIDNAVAAKNKNTGLVNKFASSWSSSKASELAEEVVETAFNSSSLKGKLNQLSENVTEEISDKLELLSAQSSYFAINCLQTFISSKYSQPFVAAFDKNIERSVPDPAEVVSSLPASVVSFFKLRKGSIGGIGVIVAAQITKRIAAQISKRVTQQVVERIFARLGTGALGGAFGEIIGLAMIGIDVAKSFEGALPQIQQSLKESDIKRELQNEIASVVEEELRNESVQIEREISNDLFSKWLEFQKEYIEMLSFAKNLPEFKRILERYKNDLDKVSSLVARSLVNTGRASLELAIQDGSFERALSLPESTYKILEIYSLPVLIEWANLAGNQLEDVVETELYKSLPPKKLDHELLVDILSLQDPSTISKLSLLETDTIRSLLLISKRNLVSLSNNLSVDDLERLSGYLQKLEQPQVNQLVGFLLGDPEMLRNSNVMAHIIQSRDINAAVQFWNQAANPLSLLNGVLTVLTGAISWHLFADKSGLPIFFLFLLVPILLLLSIIRWLYLEISKVSQKQEPQKSQTIEEIGESHADDKSGSTTQSAD